MNSGLQLSLNSCIYACALKIVWVVGSLKVKLGKVVVIPPPHTTLSRFYLAVLPNLRLLGRGRAEANTQSV
jgi:hypothetical protein